MKFEMAKNLNGYGVAFLDSERDYLIRHFDGFKKQDAKEIVRFCNVVINKIAEQISDSNCARVIQVGNGFYVTKNFECIDGDTLSFSSHGFKNEIAADLSLCYNSNAYKIHSRRKVGGGFISNTHERSILKCKLKKLKRRRTAKQSL